MARRFASVALLTAVASVNSLVACSSATRDVAPITSQPAQQPRTMSLPRRRSSPEALVYVPSFLPGTVTIYPSEQQNPKPIRTISGLAAPSSVWIDASGRLYVTNDFKANNPYTDTVTEFAPGGSKPDKVLKGLQFPNAVTVDGNGTVFVADYGVIKAYDGGSTKPTRRITAFPNAAKGSLTVDASGNVYATLTWGEYCISAVAKISPSNDRGYLVTEKVAACADGVALDGAGNLYFAYYGDDNVSEVDVYRPGSLKPFRRILQGVNGPYTPAFDRDGNLYVPNDNPGNVTVYAPGGNKPIYTITTGPNPFGVAIAPRAPLAP